MKARKRKSKREEAVPVIGRITKYVGTEHAHLQGYTVKIIAVLKNAARTDYDPDADGQYITDEEALARAGGVTADDRVEIQPFLEKEGRFSFVSSDPLAIDLEAFKHLRRQPESTRPGWASARRVTTMMEKDHEQQDKEPNR